jgi:protein regulator of cytokinesis 1
LEEQIIQVKQEASRRKEILDQMEKWMSACEEEGWLEDYNKDESRFSSKGAHLNLKRAERARAAINKLPALVESLTLRTRAWEEENGIPFLFDGVRLLAMLDEYNFLRQEKDEEKRRLRVCVKHLTTSKSKIIANSLLSTSCTQNSVDPFMSMR